MAQWTRETLDQLKEVRLISDDGNIRTSVCRHDKFNKTILLKSIYLVGLRPEDKDGIRSRIEKLSKLKHPHLLAVETVVDLGETIHVVSRFVDLLDLDAMVQKCSSDLTEQTIASIFKQIIGLLAYIHDCEVVHGAISPQCIFTSMPSVVKDGASRFSYIVKVDVGVPRFYFARKVAWQPGRLAPEQPQSVYVAPGTGGLLDAKGDVWSAGMVLYRLCASISGQVRCDDQLLMLFEGNQEPIRSLAVSGPMALLVEGMLNRLPRARPEVGSVLEALVGIASARSDIGRRASSVESPTMVRRSSESPTAKPDPVVPKKQPQRQSSPRRPSAFPKPATAQAQAPAPAQTPVKRGAKQPLTGRPRFMAGVSTPNPKRSRSPPPRKRAGSVLGRSPVVGVHPSGSDLKKRPEPSVVRQSSTDLRRTSLSCVVRYRLPGNVQRLYELQGKGVSSVGAILAEEGLDGHHFELDGKPLPPCQKLCGFKPDRVYMLVED